MSSLEIDKAIDISQTIFEPWETEHSGKPLKVEGNIPVSLPIENGDRFLFISRDQRALTHGIHKYPAKFFPGAS